MYDAFADKLSWVYKDRIAAKQASLPNAYRLNANSVNDSFEPLPTFTAVVIESAIKA
jgi:hypothetical protein